jgi:HK97 gp10 family phage protein
MGDGTGDAKISIELKVIGLEKVQEKLKRIAQKFPQKADRIIEDNAEAIFALSQSLVPVETGRLQISGSHEHIFLASRVGYHTNYAAFVEFGTSKMAAQPYLRPAVDAYLEKIINDLEKLIKEE